ncbi:MAG: hypothetical protein MH112_13315 [Phenylobacterium sp.]|uniref:hypothetical protein n=1 Tax=Phenylobacterium sp. TaxID=1871053 RepID=UPI0025DB2091|nr:hypothetical protein [Phenylobacterium sp.]MCG9917322.1 hypothetical protein [Phenylobacterium sp.]
MARSIAFDRPKALNKAMVLVWGQGVQATSPPMPAATFALVRNAVANPTGSDLTREITA